MNKNIIIYIPLGQTKIESVICDPSFFKFRYLRFNTNGIRCKLKLFTSWYVFSLFWFEMTKLCTNLFLLIWWTFSLLSIRKMVHFVNGKWKQKFKFKCVIVIFNHRYRYLLALLRRKPARNKTHISSTYKFQLWNCCSKLSHIWIERVLCFGSGFRNLKLTFHMSADASESSTCWTWDGIGWELPCGNYWTGGWDREQLVLMA